MRKILIIPHHPANAKVRIRLNEMAKALASRPGNDVFYLNWLAATGDYTCLNRIKASFLDVFKLPRTCRRDSINYSEIPTLHRPVFLARPFNRLMLHRLLKENRFDVVVNGSYYLFSTYRGNSFTYVVDLADLPSNSPCDRFVDNAIRREARIADKITVVSHGLMDYASSRYGKSAVFLPNGVDLAALRSIPADALTQLRQRYGLEGKLVIGYLGYIGDWVNVELATAAFRIFRKDVSNAVLLWIGSGPDLERLRRTFSGPDIRFIGGIDREIETHCNLFDIGILPHRVSPFQDMAFHIKLVEYAAARKPVVSTRLKESMRLALPNVLFADEDPAAWSRALAAARSIRWRNEWDSCVEPFDWKNICDTFDSLIERK